jgi:hypothetical protein
MHDRVHLPIAGNVSGLGRITHNDFRMASGEMGREKYANFLTQSFSLQGEFSRDGALNFQCIDWRHLEEISVAGRAAYDELLNVCVWCKSNGGMGSLYRSKHEFIFVFKHGRAAHTNNVMLGKFGRNRTNCWHYPAISSLSKTGPDANSRLLHPTPKPIRLISDALMDCTHRGDLVLDAFLGSGSTLIAAERIDRRCFGIEIEPVFVDRLIRRWQQFTGCQAIHVASGRLFDDLEACRG